MIINPRANDFVFLNAVCFLSDLLGIFASPQQRDLWLIERNDTYIFGNLNTQEPLLLLLLLLPSLISSSSPIPSSSSCNLRLSLPHQAVGHNEEIKSTNVGWWKCFQGQGVMRLASNERWPSRLLLPIVTTVEIAGIGAFVHQLVRWT